MAEYIERATVLQILAANLSIFEDSDESARVSMVDISALPALDVAPVRRGRWMEEHLSSTSGGFYAVVRCSECRSQFPKIYKTHYCPSCGAKMDGA